MSTATQPRGAHLLGSFPLPSAEDVFRTTSPILGRHLRRLPDGETGDRARWIIWQIPTFRDHPQLEQVPGEVQRYSGLPRYRIRPDVDPSSLRFERLGYADAALASWQTFQRLQGAGVIPAHLRFQVCIPPPSAFTFAYIQAPSRAAVTAALTTRLLAEVDQICAAIPQERLALQWDVAVEVGAWEGRQDPVPEDLEGLRQQIADHLAHLGDHVPAAVELGFHWCYGDYQHKHSKEPDDLGTCVAMTNRVLADVHRPVQWIHMPVPIERDDDAYFAPLRDIRLRPDTELYLGLVHFRDQEAGTRRRIAAAQQVTTAFGVATECGLGRRPPERGGAPDTLRQLLQLHAAVAAPVVS